jgi:hypothetical protein
VNPALFEGPVEFKEPHLKEEFRSPETHPELVARLLELDAWCVAHDIPGVILTALWRTPDFYARNGLSPKPFSWHFVKSAADLRIWHWSAAQQALIRGWLDGKCEPPIWEVLVEKHGTGEHFHLARKDFSRRRAWEAERNAANP